MIQEPTSAKGWAQRLALAGSAVTSGTVVDAATVVWPLTTYPIGVLTLGGNRTIANPSVIHSGSYCLVIRQDATGSRTVTWGTAFKWPSGTAPTLSTAANSVDIISFIAQGGSLYGVAQVGFA